MSNLLFRVVARRYGRAALLMLVCVLAYGLPVSTPSIARAEQDAETGGDGEHTPGQPAAWDVVADAAAAPLAPAGARVQAAATDCLGSPVRRVRYTSDNVIHLEGCGQVFTL